MPDVVAIAGDPDPSVRRAVVATLQALDDIRSLPGLVALTSDPERDIRESAVTGVTRLYLPRESGIGPSLTRVVNFFNPNSDEWADVVIEPDLGVDPTVVPALQARLQDPSDGIRVKAARSLGILRGRTAVPMLVLVMKEDRNPSVRFEAIRAIGKIGDTTAAKDVLPFTLSTEVEAADGSRADTGPPARSRRAAGADPPVHEGSGAAEAPGRHRRSARRCSRRSRSSPIRRRRSCSSASGRTTTPRSGSRPTPGSPASATRR